MALSFTVHGNSHIWVQNNIIVIESQGPWNIEYFQGLHQDLINVVKHHALVNYGVLLIPIGEAIGVSEAIDFHVNFLRQGKAKAVAINLAQSDTPMSTEGMCKVAYQAAGLEHEFFYSNKDAMLWLASKTH